MCWLFHQINCKHKAIKHRAKCMSAGCSSAEDAKTKLKIKDIAMATNAGVYLMLISWHSKTEQKYLIEKQFTYLNKFYSCLLLHYLLYIFPWPTCNTIVKPLSHWHWLNLLRLVSPCSVECSYSITGLHGSLEQCIWTRCIANCSLGFSLNFLLTSFKHNWCHSVSRRHY